MAKISRQPTNSILYPLGMSLRPGQALFVALAGTDETPGVDPAFAEVIRGTDLDPFYRDERIPAMLAAWWERIVSAERRRAAELVDATREALDPDDRDQDETGELLASLAREIRGG